MTCGDKIRQVRIKKGMGQAELARKSGISPQTLFKYEKNIITNIPLNSILSIAKALETDASNLVNWYDNSPTETAEPSNISAIYNDKIYNIPLYESVSAGFGAYADEHIIDYLPLYFKSAYEAKDSLCIKVSGDSMFPKIEDGDIIVVQKQTSVDSGDVAVVLIDDNDSFVKKVIYDDNNIELHSFNPMYPVIKFSGENLLRVRVVGKVKKVIKDL